jgi:uncharacterized protein YecE (DUF72 family)
LIRVGVAGWDYPDWTGVVYPSPRPRGFDRLSFLAKYFDALEINVTFYRQVDPEIARSWASRVPAGGSFRFTVKLYRAFTHAAKDSPRLSGPVPRDLQTEADLFRAGIEPLVSAGLLGAVLAQFPHSFHDRLENRRQLDRLARLLEGLPLVVEFRHRSWDHEETLRHLETLGFGFCNIDQPAVGSTLRPTSHATSQAAYIRLHGRNAENWFRKGAPAFSRYDYLYSMEELLPWVERARSLAQKAEEVFIIANNHYRGKGPANGLMLKGALTRRRVSAPADLVAAYPPLAEVADPDGRPPVQGRLF